MASLGLPFPEKIQRALQVNQSGFEEDEVAFAAVTDIAALPELTPAEVAAHLASPRPPLLLDVREPEEFTSELGHIRGSLLVPLDALDHRLPKLAGYVDREVIVVCRAGARSASAGAILRRAGFHCGAQPEGRHARVGRRRPPRRALSRTRRGSQLTPRPIRQAGPRFTTTFPEARPVAERHGEERGDSA